jgi:hypothetical protein
LRRSDWHGNCGNRISFRKGLLGLEDFLVTPPCSRGQAHRAIMDSSPPPPPPPPLRRPARERARCTSDSTPTARRPRGQCPGGPREARGL